MKVQEGPSSQRVLRFVRPDEQYQRAAHHEVRLLTAVRRDDRGLFDQPERTASISRSRRRQKVVRAALELRSGAR